MFPRHVLEHIVSGAGQSGPAAVANLATSHESVTIMFMDIVGEKGGRSRGRGGSVRAVRGRLLAVKYPTVRTTQ